MKVTREGLDGYHWLIAVILGLSNWVMSALFKFLPDSMFPELGKKKKLLSQTNRVDNFNPS
jgi:hypothetical protein